VERQPKGGVGGGTAGNERTSVSLGPAGRAASTAARRLARSDAPRPCAVVRRRPPPEVWPDAKEQESTEENPKENSEEKEVRDAALVQDS
jgi:hypothetical protein